MQLADANSATLGFLPYGAFRRLAAEGLILACVSPQTGCIGYLLYEVSGYGVKLRHLCIAEQWRGKGGTKALIKYLKNKTHHLQGVQASCRRDYNLRGMWAALGFVAVHERLGRRKEGSILTEWWLDYGHPDLLTALTQQPLRLAGTSIERKRVQTGEQDVLIDLFLNYALGENKVDFRRKLRQSLSDVDHFKCFTVGRRDEVPIALITYERRTDDELVVQIFRFRDTQLTPTILRHCVFDCFSKAANEGRKFTRITETKLEAKTTLALQEDYFLETPEGWLRSNLKIVESLENILSYLSHTCRTKERNYDCFLPLVENLTDQNLVGDSELAADIERILYPAKITDAEIPSFIIPIQSWWAKDLFDKELAEEILWGAKEELALRREVVYYRSKQASGGLQAPGQILWYVSKTGGDGSYSTLSAIRACSRLDEIIVGKPIDLHKRFRRLGIYSFKDVLKTARNDFNREIMAVRFSDTELFKKPIELREIERIIGRRISVQAPYKLTSKDFTLLYNSGIFTDSER